MTLPTRPNTSDQPDNNGEPVIDRRRRPREEELTVAQAVEESGFSEDTIRRHIAKGALPIVRRGPTQRIRILRSAFDHYLLKN